QVVEAWLPALKVERICVADDEAAANPLVRAAMGLAVPPPLRVRIEALLKINYVKLNEDEVKTLLLVRDVAGVVAATERGLKLSHLNLGNIHFERGRQRVSGSVFLSLAELNQLKALVEQGVEVEARAVP